MSSFLYKVREFLQNLIPVFIIGGLAFGGYHLYKKGTFNHGIRPAMNSIVKKIPYFGTKFGHYTSGPSRGYYVSKTGKKKHSKFSKARRHGRKMVTRRGHKRHRRHR